jgi:hypothetical protein
MLARSNDPQSAWFREADAMCPQERALGKRAAARLKMIVDRGNLELTEVRSCRAERDRHPKPPVEPAFQVMNTEKANGESTPPAITSFSPARSGASSPRK